MDSKLEKSYFKEGSLYRNNIEAGNITPKADKSIDATMIGFKFFCEYMSNKFMVKTAKKEIKVPKFKSLNVFPSSRFRRAADLFVIFIILKMIFFEINPHKS